MQCSKCEMQHEKARQLASSWPRYYFRLIDDGMFIWEGDQDGLQQFMQLLSSLLPNIKLKLVTSDSCLQYLDVWVSKDMSASGSMVPDTPSLWRIL